MIENKKKIKEWVRFIFFFSLFILKKIVLKKQIWAFYNFYKYLLKYNFFKLKIIINRVKDGYKD